MKARELAGPVLAALMFLLVACTPISADPRVGQWVVDKPMNIPVLGIQDARIYINVRWQNYGRHTQTYVVEQMVRVPAQSEQADSPWQQESHLITARDENGQTRRWWEFGQTDYMLKGEQGGLCETSQQCPLRLESDRRHLQGSLRMFRREVKVKLVKFEPLKRQQMIPWKAHH